MGIAENVADKIINDHHILIETSLCSRFRTPKSDCSLCADACPANAITVLDGGAEISAGCIDCGVCYSACPNSAFEIRERSDKKILEEIPIPLSSPLRISCERGDASSDLIVPCLSRLTEVLLLEPMLRGVSGIEIARPSCEGCPLVKVAFHFDTIIRRMHYLYDMLDISRDLISIKNIPLQGLVKAPEKAVSRRAFFGAFGAKAAGIAGAVIPDIEGSGAGKTEIFRNAIENKHENNKRSMLIARILALGAKAKVNQTAIPTEDSIIADIEIGPGCAACGVCASLCPTGAITQQWTEKTFSLGFRPSLCTNCRICEKTCMHGAITIKETVSPALLLQQGETVLFEAERKTCIACGMDFVGEGEGICPLCLDRNKKHKAALQELFK